uniref:50S ribosomal protein L35 n=1 Tax=Zea mays TaxID=4577 RepID=A0A804LBV4_MAIZE
MGKKGCKMKTHKRFRVTRKDKIMRRCAGKQHLLAKKNTKRKKRLSKMEMFADLWAKGFSLLGFICFSSIGMARYADTNLIHLIMAR